MSNSLATVNSDLQDCYNLQPDKTFKSAIYLHPLVERIFMLGKLSNEQIVNVLHSQTIGRIGCIEEGRPYIVPISYAFDNGYIYGHSMEGLKIKIMRKNPRVCFQVDSIDNMTNWRSVIAWGEFEEMKNEDEYESGMRILKNRLAPFTTSSAVRTHQNNDKNLLNYVVKAKKILVFRIKILEQSGRFENSNLL